MTIRDWEGVALIIGAGDIGKCISEYLITVSPRLDVIVCGRNPSNKNGIFFDLEIDRSFTSFEYQISLLKKPLRLVINTSGFLHSNLVKPEKRLSHINRANIIKNFSINAIAPILIAKSIDTMENDWLYEFQKYIKKFALLIILIFIILLIVLVLY